MVKGLDADALARELKAARQGSREAGGRLLENCRPYLLLIANQEMPADLRAKVGASDVVQETFLEADRGLGRFEGTSEAELLAWLRVMLLHNIANIVRYWRVAAKRQVDREIALDDSANQVRDGLPADGETPSAAATARDQDAALTQALASLPEHYRRVLQWRNYERLEFAEIGRRIDRSAEAARKIWSRAVERLQALLESTNDGG
ncbi:MAG: sigma-70 family RNA polymerase sigma factor [Planctomycetia bacterium]